MSKEELPARPPLSRRDFIRRAGAWAACASTVTLLPSFSHAASEHIAVTTACDEDYDFLLARVKFKCDYEENDRWNRYPGGDKHVLQKLSEALRCRVKLPIGCKDADPKDGQPEQFNGVVTLFDLPAMRRFPMLMMVTQFNTSLTTKEKDNLGEYLSAGGFLYADDTAMSGSTPPMDRFYKSMWDILDEIFGKGSVSYLPMDHEIMHNVYDMRKIGVPRVAGVKRPPTGLTLGGRLAAFLTASDVQCGWAETWMHTHIDRGQVTHGWEECVAMGVNICAYAMMH